MSSHNKALRKFNICFVSEMDFENDLYNQFKFECQNSMYISVIGPVQNV